VEAVANPEKKILVSIFQSQTKIAILLGLAIIKKMITYTLGSRYRAGPITRPPK